MFEESLDCKEHPRRCLFILNLVKYSFTVFMVVTTFVLQVGVGFLAQYLIKPMLGFVIAMVRFLA